MITEDKAIENARLHTTGWDFIDNQAEPTSVLLTRPEILKAGITDPALVRDEWLISFPRIPFGHPLDEVYPFVTIRVDAETGEASMPESL